MPPIGYVTFCQIHKFDCRLKGPFADRMQLTPAKFSELKQVNDQVNTTVVPMTDLEHYGKVDWWAYPVDNKGDCEDYVLEKRRRLILHGSPEGALLITVVPTRTMKVMPFSRFGRMTAISFSITSVARS